METITWVAIIVQQLRMWPGYFERAAPRRRVLVSDYTPPALPRPVEPPLKQLRVEDERPLAALEAERDALVDELRALRLANANRFEDAELRARLKAMDEHKVWLEDQIRRKRAAKSWKLAS